MGSSRDAARLIAESEGLLLDFDGPVCDVFAGSSAATIAAEVRQDFKLDIRTSDPLELITYALQVDGPVDEINEVLARHELNAVRTSVETPGVRDLIEEYRRPIAIVSNNHVGAIRAWLRSSGLQDSVNQVVGRDPRRMKPDPHPLNTALESIGCKSHECVFIGDSRSDIEAGRAAGVPVIALANKPRKRALFSNENCAVVRELTEIAGQWS